MKKTILASLIISLSVLSGGIFAVESGDHVCYWYDRGKNAKWCGVVLQDYGKAVRVEVTEVTCDRFLCTQLNSSECSGHKDLPTYSSGQVLTVKKYCID